MSYIDWPGRYGGPYRYWFVDMNKPFASLAGNYVFVKQLQNGNFSPLYFGETSDFSSRMPTHEVWPRALLLGATHALVHPTQGGEAVRCSEEADLVGRWNPVLNTHYRTTG